VPPIVPGKLPSATPEGADIPIVTKGHSFVLWGQQAASRWLFLYVATNCPAKEISTMIGRNYSQSALLRSQIDTLELNLKEIAVIRWRLAAQKRALEQAEAQLVPREAAE